MLLTVLIGMLPRCWDRFTCGHETPFWSRKCEGGRGGSLPEATAFCGSRPCQHVDSPRTPSSLILSLLPRLPPPKAPL